MSVVLQRILVRVVERGQEQRALFSDQFLPLADDATDAAIELTFGLDDRGAYIRGAKLKDEREILYINQRFKSGAVSEMRVTHKFFEEERFHLDFEKCECSLHLLNTKPSAFFELVDMFDTDNPNTAALGLECCADIREAGT